MTDASTWLDGNSKYLSAAVAWVRATLQDRVDRREAEAAPMQPTARQQTTSPQPTQPPSKLKTVERVVEAVVETAVVDAVERETFWKWKGFAPRTQPKPSTPILLGPGTPIPTPPAPAEPPPEPPPEPASAPPVSQSLEAAKAALDEAASAIHPPPALLILSQLLGLSPFERDILMLCVGFELDSEIAALCARCPPGSRQPTFALAFSLFQEASWDALSPEKPLRFWKLVEIIQNNGDALAASPLRLDERLLSYVKGLNTLDERLSPYLEALDTQSNGHPLPPSHSLIIDQILARLTQGESAAPMIQLLGNEGATKQSIAGEITRSMQLQLYKLQAALLPTHAADLELMGRLWHRERLLMPLALFVEAPAFGAEPQAGPSKALLGRFLDRVGGSVFLDTRESFPASTRPSHSVDVTRPTTAEQVNAWKDSLGEAAGDIPARLADQFNLDLPTLHTIAHESLTAADHADVPLADRLWTTCLLSCRPKLDGLAQRLEPKATWDDFVLPPHELNLLKQIAEQVANRATVYQTWGYSEKLSRGLGISALFAGDSGTGKSMAAEVIANHLKLNLYRIDLSAVVSKYIGETEKNLRQLFDNAEMGGTILFFDEADALFGKRSEVKDSHDRYSNIEVNYLLQRMEAYRGLAILATNSKSALDLAFFRRLRFVVNFPFPAATERKAIWQRAFTASVPKDDLDFDRLARLNIAGGHIHSIALNAAFLAAREKSKVTMPLILDAARTEFQKLERPINELDFRLPARSVSTTSTPEAAPKGATA
ncbi:ATP-binding protein [Granulicella sibirica]|uniref:ATPase, AAA family n=1 Tax=Granulicella sibirica TaxID=2479048 RepID=A0A4V1L5P9_9BACT|nr:ATP-binding protein [Granulicella sibirica]RXH56524.1 ATPase, AAA family [Granulicella sibirica]